MAMEATRSLRCTSASGELGRSALDAAPEAMADMDDPGLFRWAHAASLGADDTYPRAGVKQLTRIQRRRAFARPRRGQSCTSHPPYLTTRHPGRPLRLLLRLWKGREARPFLQGKRSWP